MKRDDIRMMQSFQQSNFIDNPYTFRLGHSPQLDYVPRNFNPLNGIIRTIDVFVGTRAKLFFEANVSFGGGLFNDCRLLEDVWGDVIIFVVFFVVFVELLFLGGGGGRCS